MPHVLAFEKHVVDLMNRLRELKEQLLRRKVHGEELEQLEQRTTELTREVLQALSPHEKVQLSRHPNRPYTLDYLRCLFTDWIELHGDRRFADDAALVCGLARYHGRNVVVIGHQKGRNAKENVERRFGCPNPEGYRKAIRLYEMADRFRLPILTFIDTQGAYPGIGAEERGQAEAIAHALEVMAGLRVPVVATIIGEGGSGGALALGVANRILVLEYGFYSVISPEGCASILWKSAEKAAEAAARLKITAPHLLDLRIVDAVVPEPPGGAHRDHEEAARLLDHQLRATLEPLCRMSPKALREDRYRRFRQLGSVVE